MSDIDNFHFQNRKQVYHFY